MQEDIQLSEEEQRRIFAKNLNHYIYLNGKQQKEVAKDLGFSPTTFNTWCMGKIMPKMGKVQAIADYFGILKSDLINDNNYETQDSEYANVSLKIGMNDKRFQRIIVEYYKMPINKKEAFCNFMETFILKKGD